MTEDTPVCTDDNCGNPSVAKGLCHMHYMRWWRSQDEYVERSEALRKERAEARAARVTKTPYQLLLDSVIVTPDGCWEVHGRRNHSGYSRIWVPSLKRMVMGHRVSYEQNVGPVPDGLVLDHMCRNRACIFPGHLKPSDLFDNSQNNSWFARDCCSRGHPYTEESTRIEPSTSRQPGTRVCRICRAENARRRRAGSRGS